MELFSEEPRLPHASAAQPTSFNTKEAVRRFDPKLQQVREAVTKGNYQLAIELLPADMKDVETRNCLAVCLIRMYRFEQAVDVLRTSVIDSSTQTVRAEVADHIKVNYAIALFYGGRPAGALEVLQETSCENDPGVKRLRHATAEWVSRMSLLRRLDWKINRITPKALPIAAQEKLGRFDWEVV